MNPIEASFAGDFRDLQSVVVLPFMTIYLYSSIGHKLSYPIMSSIACQLLKSSPVERCEGLGFHGLSTSFQSIKNLLP